jgi:hypothetical protein
MNYDIRDMKLTLARNGFCLHSKGNFHKYSFYHKRLILPIYTYLEHRFGNDNLDNYQLQKLCFHLHLSKDEFVEFLSEKMTKKIYVEMLKNKGVIPRDEEGPAA